MRSSLILAAMSVGSAFASPILQKKAVVTDLVTDYVWVYVTEGVPLNKPTHTHSASGAPTTPVVLVAAVSTTSDAAAIPTTTAAPVAASTSESAVSVVMSSAAEGVQTAAAAAATTSQVVASPSGTCPDASSATDYISTVLYHHNIHRCNHSAPALTYNEEIAGYAATLAATCNFHHDLTIGGVSYGQNIADYMGSGFDVEALGAESQVASSITDMWYNGELGAYPESGYGQDNPSFSDADAWDHFSQLVWKSSTSVGCATQYCPTGELAAGWEGWFTVCNYQVAGNMGGEYGANVLPPLGHPTITA